MARIIEGSHSFTCYHPLVLSTSIMKLKTGHLYGTVLWEFTSKALRMAHANKDHIVLPATHTFIHEWNEPFCFYSTSQLQSITAVWLVLVFYHAEGRWLSWPMWVVTYWDGYSSIAAPVSSHCRWYAICLW